MTGTGKRMTLAAMAVVMLASVAVAEQPGPAIVGAFEPASIETPRPYPVSFGVDAREWAVRWPGATYIRVHFSEFDLADGDWITISAPDGSQTMRFEGRGLHDAGAFWANTIAGDTAIIRMQATVGGNSGFTIDGFGRGTHDIFGTGVGEPLDPTDTIDPGGSDPGIDSVCGANDWEDVECQSGTTEYDMAKGAVKAIIGCCSSCTAWKISDSGQFMTNNHCTSSASGVASTELLMGFRNTACGGGGSTNDGSVFGETLVATGFTLDYTLMTSTAASDIPCLVPDANPTTDGQRMYIAHHPSGGVKKLSTVSDIDGGDCVVFDANASGRGAGTDVSYYCDTTNGSSGSPVLDADTHKVIALHHFGGCTNSGGRMDLIMGEIGSLIDSCDGSGTPPPGCVADGDGLGCDASTPCCSGTGNCTGGKPANRVCAPSASVCGDGVVEGSEDCEAGVPLADTCQTLGFDSGTLACDEASCTYDTSACVGGTTCGGNKASCSVNSDCCSGNCNGGTCRGN